MATKATTRKASPKKRTRKIEAQVDQLAVPIVRKPVIEPLKSLNTAQERYINAIKNFDLVFGLGSAGVGKTYIAGALAAQMLESKRFEKIIITRPAVEAGESLGFLPGELDEKYQPYIAPFRDVLEERLGKSYVEYLIKNKRIEAIPLGFMRGRSFKNAIVILDEAQNTTPKQMFMFLTRLGTNCKAIVDGDPSQSDIRGANGLDDAIKRLAWIPNVKVVGFGAGDVVRSGLVSDIIASYDRPVQDGYN